MEKFPLKALQPRHAILYEQGGSISIQILMTPFLWNQEIVDTSIHLDGIDLPSSTLRNLVGKSFQFPSNPVEGYIDGSIYLHHAHHPVDVTSLEFSKSRDGQLKLIVKGAYIFDHEGLDDLGKVPFIMAPQVSSATASQETRA